MTQEDEKKIKVGWIGCLGDVALCLHFDKILVGPLHQVETVSAFFRKFLDFDASEQKHDVQFM